MIFIYFFNQINNIFKMNRIIIIEEPKTRDIIDKGKVMKLTGGDDSINVRGIFHLISMHTIPIIPNNPATNKRIKIIEYPSEWINQKE